MGLLITAAVEDPCGCVIAAQSDRAAVLIGAVGRRRSVRVWASESEVLDAMAEAVRHLAAEARVARNPGASRRQGPIAERRVP